MKITDSNEWVVKDQDTRRVRVGLTKKAAAELDKIVFVKLPSVGENFKSGDEAVILESVKAAADSYSPVEGRVVSINERLSTEPDLITTDPYGEGWLYEIELTQEDEYDRLQDHP